MRKTKRRMETLSFYDHTGMTCHWEKMARRGWLLDKMGGVLWRYRKIEPQRLRFAMTYFPEVTGFEPDTPAAQSDMQAFCAQAGWQLAANAGKFQVYYNEDPQAVELDTDPGIQLEVIHRAMKKNFLPSYALLAVLISILGVQSGFVFDVRFDALSFFGVAAVLAGVVTVFTWLSAGRIKKTQPIDGLRGNTGGKYRKKNHFPLDETKGSTKLLLVLKQIFACKKQNVMLALVNFVLTVLVAFSGTLFFNVAIKPDNFMRALSDETPDVIMQVCDDRTDDLLAVLERDSRVENALQYLSGSVKMEETTVTALACSDFSKVRNDVCYAGRNPEVAHEIALGSAFGEKYKIGDSVCVTVGDITRQFEVVGFVQSVNRMGELCELSLEGYQTLFENDLTPDLYVYLHSNVDAAAVAEGYKTAYPDLVASTIDARKMMEESQKMYMDITVILVVVIFVVTILVVLFILYIVIKSLLVKRRQELGIYKAMGYTSWQLMVQTAGSFLPVSIAAILLSSVLALCYMPGIFDAIFGALGVMKNHIEISFGFLMLFAVIQIAINMIISFVLCMPIRKISAYALIKE